MKKTLLLLVLCASFLTQILAQAEVEVKERKAFEVTTNPLGLLFLPDAFFLPVSAEFIINENFGAGAEALLIASDGFFGAIVYGSAKYYFNPKYGADRFYVGSYLGGARLLEANGFGLGFMIGQKWVSSKNIVFDLAIGGGRDFTRGIGFLPYAKVNIGYRLENTND